MLFRRLSYPCVTAVTLAGAALGALTSTLIRPLLRPGFEPPQSTLLGAGLALAGATVGCLIALRCCRAVPGLMDRLRNVPLLDKLVAVAGLLVGLTVGVLASMPLTAHAPMALPLRVLITLVAAMLGVAFGLSARPQLSHAFPALAKRVPLPERPSLARPKLLDASIIIDGRIAEICQAGFLEGPLLLPEFVLRELHRTADSADEIERALGRRALELLNRLKALPRADLRVYDGHVASREVGEGVSMSVVKLARQVGAEVLTNDSTVVEIARVHGVPVLALDELTGALRRSYHPGEELVVTIVAEGKQAGQGVAYVDDRTMVVVEGAAHLQGRSVPVVVARTLQTNSGRTLFAVLAMEEARAAAAGGKS